MISEVSDLIFRTLLLVNEDKYELARKNIDKILKASDSLNNLETNDWQYIADISLALGDFNLAKKAYKNANNLEGEAFILILENKLNDAKKLLSKSDTSPASSWCRFLLDLFSGNRFIISWPSFLLIRQFLEFTVYYLLLAKRNDFIEVIFKNLKKFLIINEDSEKFIGYAYFHYGETDRAIEILKNSLKDNQFDGEVYFVLGQAYYKKHSYYDALAVLENARLFLPHHTPTKELLNKVRESISEML